MEMTTDQECAEAGQKSWAMTGDKGDAKVKFNFEANKDSELSLQKGEVIVLLDDSDFNWWKGRTADGKEGMFPAPFVERLPNLKVSAKFNFEASDPGELSLKKGDLLTLLESTDQNWWRGRKNGKEGVFPAKFVERCA